MVSSSKKKVPVAEIVNDKNILTLSVEETAAMMGQSKSWVYERLQANKLPHIKVGNTYIISKALILELINTDSTGGKKADLSPSSN